MDSQLARRFLVRALMALLLCMTSLTTLAGQAAAAVGTIQGTVTDASSAPVDGAVISVRTPGTTTEIATTTSDPTGFYSLAVEEGTYDLLVSGPTGSGLSRYLSNVSVSGSTTVDAQILPVVEFVEVSGTVFGPGGVPVNGNNVTFRCPNGSQANGTIGSTGTYTLTAPSSPNCTVSTGSQLVTTNQISNWYASYPGVNTTTGTADLAFPATTPITINVVNPDKTPADVASITSRPDLDISRHTLPTGQLVYIDSLTTTTTNQPTATHPTFTGITHITVTLTNGTTLTTTLNTNNTTDITLEAPLVEFVEVSGTVFGPGGVPVNGNNVTFRCPNGSQANGTIGSTGTYTLTAPSSPNCTVSTGSQLVTTNQISNWYAGYPGVNTTTGTADLAFPATTPITINVVNPDKTPADVASITSRPDLDISRHTLPTGQFVYIDSLTTTTTNQPTATHPTFTGITHITVTLTNGTTLTTTLDTNNTT